MALDGDTSAIEAKFNKLRIDITKTLHASAPAPTTITVTALPTPPFSPAPAAEASEPVCLPPPVSLPDPPSDPNTFYLFPFLPAELRLKIWHFACVPRTVELHTQRTHYADDEYITPRWQSRSRNAAVLSVSVEARAAASEVYYVRLPLALPDQILLRPSDRVLYINPEQDMVALLGDLHFPRLTRTLDWFRKQDSAHHRARRGAIAKRGKGLRRLAMGVAQWTHPLGAATLKAFAPTVFGDIEEFVLFLFKDREPPETWTGELCLIADTDPAEDSYRRFVVGWGKPFREGSGWITVGKRPLKMVDIYFLDG
ncbi:hypothetical protein OQA88_5565 [Cercophora sp. LCS_1]